MSIGHSVLYGKWFRLEKTETNNFYIIPNLHSILNINNCSIVDEDAVVRGSSS